MGSCPKCGWPVFNSPALFTRPLGHLLFFWFLAAAAWVDIRYRVIPDVITTPGVSCGLVALVIFPGILLPIPVITERSFAPATLTADFLVAWGLQSESGRVIDISRRGTTMALFVLWWVVCTSRWTNKIMSIQELLCRVSFNFLENHVILHFCLVSLFFLL